ncbi:Signal transduction histidine kinase, nitrogen specific [Hahella chejuensis KCTC 2396]|uniref:Sensory histidine kinase/phosphatase NtrB n=1 Tax=Hahella chejuensis (strain KCTC 2396) TaxID=349521 RepID=Q2SN58_HAHCH|nr:nitrogen regulation protein NR(II) [Hahella chejuensis]ABC27916.1 Signal transduction histidine kinase, nitrogen specific [Hahella chejuensis KCTC 2396]
MLPIVFQTRLLENLTTSVLVIDPQQRIAFSNSSAEVLLETSEQRANGATIKDLLIEGSSTLTGLEECLRTGQTYTQREAEFLLPSGSRLLVDYTVSPVHIASDVYVIMEIQPRDRLLRISREEELLSKQETSRILIRGLAHEIKNPLGGIRGAAQLLDKELKEEGLHDYTRIIIDEADRLRNLVDRMLGPNRSFKQEPTNIHEVLERVYSLIEVESAGKIKLIRDYDPSIPEFAGDKEQLIQAFLNICRNAMQAFEDYTPPGSGGPQILLRTRPLRQFTIGHMRHRLVVRVDVIDNGPGIPSEFLNNIFYPMVSGRAQGTGLGLSITQSIIGQHKGLVECESQPGSTNFIIFIPLEPLS